MLLLLLDNSRKESAKKNDDQVHTVRKDWMQYFSTLGVDYLTVVLPIILVFTVSNPSLYNRLCLVAIVFELKSIEEHTETNFAVQGIS